MKKFYLAAVLIFIAFSSCKKTEFDATAQAAVDDAAIQAYLKVNNLTATKDPGGSGLYYQIVTQGTGVYPVAATSSVSVNYVGKLLDGTVFDKATAFSTNIASGDVISGWTIGIPLARVGSRIILYVPSYLGYGNGISGSIPANSVLIFTIDVLSSRG
jgi:FKBP-type peptidyl-prolyl cis-trans isomerase